MLSTLLVANGEVGGASLEGLGNGSPSVLVAASCVPDEVAIVSVAGDPSVEEAAGRLEVAVTGASVLSSAGEKLIGEELPAITI